MSIPLILTNGFGNGTFSGAIKDIVTMGFDIGIQVIIDLETFGVSTIIKNNIGFSVADISQGLGVSVKISDTIGTSTKI